MVVCILRVIFLWKEKAGEDAVVGQEGGGDLISAIARAMKGETLNAIDELEYAPPPLFELDHF